MLTLQSVTVAGLAVVAGLGQVASAASEAKLLTGVCQPYPGVMRSGTGNAFTASIYPRPVGTGTEIDSWGSNTKWSSILETQRGVNPWYTVRSSSPLSFFFLTSSIKSRHANDPNKAAVHNREGAAPNIGCTDEDGLIYYPYSSTPAPALRINTQRGGTLVNGSYGFIPEPYAYYVDGVRQPGVYIGAAGEVRWAWSKFNDTQGREFWKPRLMVSLDGNPGGANLQTGEVQGFLVSLPWGQ
jgi:hypothetical protein